MSSNVTYNPTASRSGTVAMLEYRGLDDHHRTVLFVTALFPGVYGEKTVENMVWNNQEQILVVAKKQCDCYTSGIEFYKIRSKYVVKAADADLDGTIQITAAMYDVHSLY
jgi:hypothetical protein